jgi:hypothetical protein
MKRGIEEKQGERKSKMWKEVQYKGIRKMERSGEKWVL